MSVSLEVCVLSGLITCPELPYRFVVSECDREASIMRNTGPLAAVCLFVCLFLARQPPVVQGLLIHEVSRSHTTHNSR
jgi:hypothetical protein